MEHPFLKADLHLHTHHSFDGSLTPKQLVAEAKAKGLHVVGVTDHGTTKGGREVAKLAGKSLIVLVGQEVKTKDGDILVFNIDEDLPEGQDAVRTCERARALGGFIILPHPFDPMRQVTGKNTERLAKYADAIEGFNAKCFFNWSNTKAQEFALAKGIPAVAGSDAHKPGEVGRAYTLVEGRDVLEAIRAGRVSIPNVKVDKGDLLKKRVKKVFSKW